MTGQTRLFIPQELLDRWVVAECVTLEGETLTLRDGHQAVRLTPAIRVLKVSTGEGDPHALCGRVKSGAEIAALRGEHYMTSLLVGEIAYDVQAGFIGEPQAYDPQSLHRLRTTLLGLG
jgi:hypothetical protein